MCACTQDEQPRFERQSKRDDVAFFQAMVEAGYPPNLKTDDPRGSQPMRVAPGLSGPVIRSSADI